MVVEKPRINWESPLFLAALKTAIETSGSTGEVAKKLDKQFLPSEKDSHAVTPSSIIGGLRRENVVRSFGELYPNEIALLQKFKKNNLVCVQKSTKQPRPRVRRKEQVAVKAPEPKPVARREPTEAEVRDTQKIEEYFLQLARRDQRRKLLGS